MCTPYHAASAVGEVVGSLGLVLVWDITSKWGVKHILVGCFMLLAHLQLHHLGVWHHPGCDSLRCLCFGVSRGSRFLCSVGIVSRRERGGKGLIKRELSSLDQFYEECKTSLGYLRVSCTRGAS